MSKPRRIITTATYQADAHETFLAALDFRELQAAMKGMSSYDGLPDHELAQGKTYKVDVTTWKVFKTKNYEMFIERLDKEAYVLQSREKGGAITKWDHHLSVRQDGEQAIWTDDIVIEAGLLTPLMARMGAYMYRRRHKYRQALSITTQIK